MVNLPPDVYTKLGRLAVQRDTARSEHDWSTYHNTIEEMSDLMFMEYEAKIPCWLVATLAGVIAFLVGVFLI